MAERDRLRALQMREAGHDVGGMGQRLFRHRRLQAGELAAKRVDGVADPEPEVDGDLIVARARRMQAAGGRPEALGEAGLDIHIDVFERTLERERALLDFATDRL